MRTPSHKATPTARPPRRRRGALRVASLLDAAGAVFAAKGFAAATMTEIAAHAGASIGSLYQFFPTKEVLADALIDKYTKALYGRLEALAAHARDWDAAMLTDRLLPLFVEFRAEHSAFNALADSPDVPAARRDEVRRMLRRLIAAILAAHSPRLARADVAASAVAVLQMMKAAVAIDADPTVADKSRARRELRAMLLGYLAARPVPRA